MKHTTKILIKIDGKYLGDTFEKLRSYCYGGWIVSRDGDDFVVDIPRIPDEKVSDVVEIISGLEGLGYMKIVSSLEKDLEKLHIDRERLGNRLLGTCESLDSAIEYLELDESVDWEDELLTISVETCQGCGWWMNSWDLEEDHVGNFLCDQCHEDEDD